MESSSSSNLVVVGNKIINELALLSVVGYIIVVSIVVAVVVMGENAVVVNNKGPSLRIHYLHGESINRIESNQSIGARTFLTDKYIYVIRGYSFIQFFFNIRCWLEYEFILFPYVQLINCTT